MKVIYDTCLYIDFLRDSKHEDLFRTRDFIRFLSPIVAMELMAGVKSKTQHRLLDRMFRRYIQAGRIIDVNKADYFKAGNVLSSLRSRQGVIPKTISHDVLIALSAISVGATLLTSNRKDFEAIQRYLPLKVTFLK